MALATLRSFPNLSIVSHNEEEESRYSQSWIENINDRRIWIMANRLLTSSGVDGVLRVRTHPLPRDGTDCIRAWSE